MFTLRRIDSTPEQCRGMLDEVIRGAALARDGAPAGPRDGVDSAWEGMPTSPEGIVAKELPVNRWGAFLYLAAWWTDRLGRRHWYMQAEYVTGEHEQGFKDWQARKDHPPLAFVAPPMSFLTRRRGPQSEPAVLCRCGVVGRAESLGWMGDRCGPCFDRELEGIASPGQPPHLEQIGRVSIAALAPNGQLVTLHYTPGAQGELRPFSIKAWAPPYDGGPVAEHPGQTDQNLFGVACGGRQVALLRPAHIDLRHREGLEPVTAHPLQLSGSPRRSLAYSGERGEWLLALSEGRLMTWRVTAEGGLGHLAYTVETQGARALATWPASGEVALVRKHDAIVRDVETREERHRFCFDGSFDGYGVVASPDGLIATVWQEDAYCLARWSKAAGQAATLAGLPPVVVRRAAYRHFFLTLSPDGCHLAALGWDDDTGWTTVDLFSVERLELLGSFHLAPLEARWAAFTADGQSLLVLAGHGLALYPWRELVGEM
jgi:hypothetical protein